MIARHVETNADLTVGCIEVPLEQAKAFGVMAVDENDNILRFDEKPENPQPKPGSTEVALASMGIYVFNTQFLLDQLLIDAMQLKSLYKSLTDPLVGINIVKKENI